ncbi:MAG TPA: biotin--[acetyl-CoA-carboxylase] ligase [Gaiella sp.]|nr:biotin--[acetyl-CoA-carboxylase] ligase [Gaiella sp.]
MLNQHKPLTADLVEPLLRGRLGRPYLWSESCASTQDALHDPALPEGAVAVTEHQSAGRGRAGRRWEDEPGASLLFSVLLRPPETAPSAQLSLVCALAVAEAVEAAAGLDVRWKWPNDVVADGRKLAGILLEGREGAIVCGIGVNVDQTEQSLPRETRLPPGSLRTLTGRAHDRARLLVGLLERLETHYDSWLTDGLEPLLPALERRDALRGSAVTVGVDTGVAAGIAPDGRLRVKRADGTTVLVASGEVTA